MDREEGHWIGSLGVRRQAVALLERASPGVEGGLGQAMPPAEGTHGQAAALPAFEDSSPVLLLAGIAGLALGHGQDLQDTGTDNRVLKVTTDARTGPTGRLPLRRVCQSSATEKTLQEDLILLSLCETCNYMGIKFLDFLRSERRAVEAFLGGPSVT
jgi:hypothetical protein